MKNSLTLINALTAICVFLTLSACSKSEFFTNGSAAQVKRASANQPSIKILSSPSNDPDADLMNEQGYQEAKDRLVQMDVLRRLGKARLADLLGENVVGRDTLMLGIGLPQAIEKSTAKMKAEFPADYHLLESFAAGVNRFIKEVPKTHPETINLYHQITQNGDYLPEPWEPSDSIAILKNVSFYLSSHLQDKLTLGTVALSLMKSGNPMEIMGLMNLLDLRPLESTTIMGDESPFQYQPTAKNGTKALPKGNAKLLWAKNKKNPVSQLAKLDYQCKEHGFPFPECVRQSGFGSNNFVISKNFAGAKETFLANDPHLPLTFPSTFYEVALDSTPAGGSFKVRGMNLPGIPGVLIGTNEDIAWGMTNLFADVDDIYLDFISEKEGAVIFKGQPVSVVNEAHTLRVRQKNGSVEEKQIVVRIIPHHGPVVSDVIPEIKSKIGALNKPGIEAVLSYKWTGHSPSAEIDAVMSINRAHHFESFKAGLARMESGAQNVVYADKKGNIGYYAHGNFPIRKYIGKGINLPFIPVLGDGSNEWEGFRTSVPELYNPKAGRIVTANNDPYGHTLNPKLSNYQDYFGAGFSTGCRAQRMTELIDQNKGKITAETVQKIQTDHKDLRAVRFIEVLQLASDKANLLQALSPKAQSFAARLFDWAKNGSVADRNLTEPVLYDVWMKNLSEIFFAQVAKGQDPVVVAAFSKGTIGTKTLYHKIYDLMSAAPDKVVPLLVGSLEKAAMDWESSYSPTTRWGQVNRVAFSSAIEVILPAPPSVPLERDGSADTVDVAGAGFGPNFRLIIVLKENEPNEAYNVVPGGNWGPFDSKAMVKELLRWRDGQKRELVPFL